MLSSGNGAAGQYCFSHLDCALQYSFFNGGNLNDVVPGQGYQS